MKEASADPDRPGLSRAPTGHFNDLGRTFTNTFDRHVEDILTALRAAEEPPIHARSGRRAVELAPASVRSFVDGVRVAAPKLVAAVANARSILGR